MASRSVRLDAEAERALRELSEKTGFSLSEILKRGILALRDRELGSSARTTFQIYSEIDLGPGGYTQVPARESRRGVLESLKRKRQRR